ncbi:hypothetical protein SAMN02746041_02100 [Desulfacinum hydrothermale DSM 13146]|uniref:Methionine synthase II (Cobalamin-independent) n=1 Tax=Desulfacinum hydrothermale DSM 13146 TaxID=1121390 RepID=A0A1W1XLS6_9BACT|nr:hypothetical protein [Desulfacinum hydrothermale]SMC24822.1 hypothetical protein SAMN02746041_02100 [Desulfacinum hydrothermale DSM 13146]
MSDWQPRCRPTLVGSMPHKDRQKALDVILEQVPEIPVWPQLAVYPAEQMMEQYLEGLPGVRRHEGRVWIQTDHADLDGEILSFFEDYLAVEADPSLLDDSRFAMGEETGRTFRAFLERVAPRSAECAAVKGQIVGPFTLLTGLTDQDRKAILYDERLKDVVLKHLAMKARWQVARLQALGKPVVLFLDEPALAGFGTSAYITVSADDVGQILRQVVEPVRETGALVGIHVCANTDWALVYGAGVDIINFDAYQYFDRFALYRREFLDFVRRGGIVAWGMVPTMDSRAIEEETAEALADRLSRQIQSLAHEDLDLSTILAQSLVTPSCGCGTLSESQAERVAFLTRALADRLRRGVGLD